MYISIRWHLLTAVQHRVTGNSFSINTIVTFYSPCTRKMLIGKNKKNMHGFLQFTEKLTNTTTITILQPRHRTICISQQAQLSTEKIWLEWGFTTCMPLLGAPSIFGLSKRRQSSTQRQFLRQCTVDDHTSDVITDIFWQTTVTPIPTMSDN